MTYINRDLEEKIKSASKEYACILITGARQVGKSTVLKRLMDDNREEVLLDDIEERKLASKDPALFLQMHSLPILMPPVHFGSQVLNHLSSWNWRKNLWPEELLLFTCLHFHNMKSMGMIKQNHFLLI